MAIKLKIVKGYTSEERMKSVDGLLNAIDVKLKQRTPNEGLKEEIAAIRRTLTTLMDFLGLKEEPGPERIIRRTRIVEEIEHALDTDHTL